MDQDTQPERTDLQGKLDLKKYLCNENLELPAHGSTRL